jgi:hypothetical protein
MIINGVDKLVGISIKYGNTTLVCKRALNPFMGSYSFHFEDTSNLNKSLYKISITFKDNDMVSVLGRHSEYMGCVLMKVPQNNIGSPSDFLEVVIKIVEKYNNDIF